jgi:hypothetical protein
MPPWQSLAASALQASGFRSGVTRFRLDAAAKARYGLESALRRNAAAGLASLEPAHNPEVAGSNPAPATRKAPQTRGFRFRGLALPEPRAEGTDTRWLFGPPGRMLAPEATSRPYSEHSERSAARTGERARRPRRGLCSELRKAGRRSSTRRLTVDQPLLELRRAFIRSRARAAASSGSSSRSLANGSRLKRVTAMRTTSATAQTAIVASAPNAAAAPSANARATPPNRMTSASRRIVVASPW